MSMMEINEHVPLAPYTMFNIGGEARYYIATLTDDDVHSAVMFAKAQRIPYFVLGGGSNILIADSGFDGVVIHMKNDGCSWSDDDTLLVAGSGMSWDALVETSVAHLRYGIENLSGIPGTVGGAASGNIGAYGSEVKETLEWVEVLDTDTMLASRMPSDACALGYRSSIFKQRKGKHLIILRAAFRLRVSGGDTDTRRAPLSDPQHQEREVPQ
jgi:UDP-N-acetylmuramate dehydrogenase